MWEPNRTDGHLGDIGVLLEDGTEPGPVYYDTGSGSNIHKTTNWYCYDGTLGAPRATTMRARCACGWRGQTTYPIDWDQVERRQPYLYDTSGPESDWDAHTQEVAALAVQLPENSVQLLKQLEEWLYDDDVDPLVILRAVGELEAITTSIASYAARQAGTKHSDKEIARALGLTDTVLTARLAHYKNRGR
ncbi:hypothetical protein [Streptomyces sp. DH7]|uniref:hypothetical protein n=1 Tax=Streptomyces sp. DH7 TaxID=2857006 RepID=UPI001E523B56|nr:hypothetical protein [Streptomyces sp. DH7]